MGYKKNNYYDVKFGPLEHSAISNHMLSLYYILFGVTNASITLKKRTRTRIDLEPVSTESIITHNEVAAVGASVAPGSRTLERWASAGTLGECGR